MIIRKKRIRSVENYLVEIGEGEEFRPIVRVGEEHRNMLARAGFAEPPDHGDSILPNGIGPISRFNADGKWKPNRDEPKEERYVRTVRWRWRQWTGGGGSEEHEDFRDIYRWCYPRTFIDPPGVELTYVVQGDHSYVGSPKISNIASNHDAIRHVINLMLELFGECELVKTNLESFAPIKVNRLNWSMLPPGKHPWPRLEAHLKPSLGRLAENTQSVIFDRQKTMLQFQPDELFVGSGGFSDYIAYVFKERGFVVLESIRKGNAIYVFGQGWEQFSRLSKAEVLDNRLHIMRLIHSKGWKTSLARLMDGREAA